MKLTTALAQIRPMVESNLNRLSRIHYARDLQKFTNWLTLTQRTSIRASTISYEIIQEYLDWLLSVENCAIATRHRHFATLKKYFRLLHQTGKITSDPTALAKLPDIPTRQPIYLTHAELNSLLSQPDRTLPNGIRDHAILSVLAYCGLRESELISLTLADFNANPPSLHIIGKGDKERFIPMNELSLNALQIYLTSAQITLPSAKIFPLSAISIYFLVKKYVTKAGITKRISPHKLRHTFATHLHDNDIDLLDIQTLLGHQSITTTQIYTHTNHERLAKAVQTLTTD